ncbi:MAG: metallophosphoesterase, partial [Bacteroidetes bacterium]|nr:metallophosphoesterase [Bacteroidota bacterium]
MKSINFFILLCCFAVNAQNKDIKIAFIADAHFADVYPNGLDIENLPKTHDGQPILIRSMESQLHSTRLFNENYMALKAALKDAVVNKGIKIIAMPGDFSDDGQPLHIRKLNKILNAYTIKYGVDFFMINGNHDPTRPFGKQGGKTDFLGKNGKLQPIMSADKLYHSNSTFENPTQISESLKEWGYEGIIKELNEYGFFPKEEYIYWETPFSNYNYKHYKFEFASEASKLSNRTFTFKAGQKSLPDVSYLVEPVEDVWLLALDANVYLPKKNGKGFHGAGIGYNHVMKYKPYLITWTEKVVKEAKRLGKTLIAFSHYPMLDFNDDASDEMKELFGSDKFQAYRIPNNNIGQTFANIGLKIHVGGHMHLNDTGIINTV